MKSLLENRGTSQLLHMNWNLFALTGVFMLACDIAWFSAYVGVLYSEAFVFGLSITSEVFTEVLRIGVGPLICYFRVKGLFCFLFGIFACMNPEFPK